MSGTTASPRLRRDAERNRRRLLEAASRVFAEHGPDAGVDEIARAAGVGMGTMYRRFASKEELIAALVEDAVDAMLRLAEAAADAPNGHGLEQFLERASAYQAGHRGCLTWLWQLDPDSASAARLRRLLRQLLLDAKQHGRIRAELADTDITMLMWSMRGVILTGRDAAPDAWRRHLAVLLAGIRPADPALPHRPVSRAAMRRIVADHRA